jgi:signal peptidase I
MLERTLNTAASGTRRGHWFSFPSSRRTTPGSTSSDTVVVTSSKEHLSVSVGEISVEFDSLAVADESASVADVTEPGASTARAKPGLLRRIASNPFVNLVAAFIVLGLVQAFLVKLYYVPSGSMEETLVTGDRILVNRLAYVASDPAIGDVVVFNASSAWDGEGARASSNPLTAVFHWVAGLVGIGPSGDHTLVKRLIAGPGDTVACCGDSGRVTVNGIALDEPYVFDNLAFVPGTLDCDSSPRSPRCFSEFTIPEGMYFVLGDHRSASNDSISLCRGSPVTDDTCVKLVARDDIVGRVFQTVLPLDRWGAV